MAGTSSRTATASSRGVVGRELQAKPRPEEHEPHTRRPSGGRGGEKTRSPMPPGPGACASGTLVCPLRGRLQRVRAVEGSGRTGDGITGAFPGEASTTAGEPIQERGGPAVETEVSWLHRDRGVQSATANIAGVGQTAQGETPAAPTPPGSRRERHACGYRRSLPSCCSHQVHFHSVLSAMIGQFGQLPAPPSLARYRTSPAQSGNEAMTRRLGGSERG